MFFWNSFAFPMIQRMLAIWSLVPLPFLNPTWTSGSSWFTYWWIEDFNLMMYNLSFFLFYDSWFPCPLKEMFSYLKAVNSFFYVFFWKLTFLTFMFRFTIFLKLTLCIVWGSSLVAQLVKNLPAMQETLVRFLVWEDPLEKG